MQQIEINAVTLVGGMKLYAETAGWKKYILLTRGENVQLTILPGGDILVQKGVYRGICPSPCSFGLREMMIGNVQPVELPKRKLGFFLH